MANSAARVGMIGAWLLLAWWTLGTTRGAEAVKPRDQAAAGARWSDLTPLAIHTPFDSYRYPHLDSRGNVLFIADDAYSRESKGEHHGIYRYGADGTLVCLVRGEETTVPGEAATLRTIQGLQVDENAVDFVFNAYDSEKKRGLYHWSGGQLVTVARTGVTVLPGDVGPLRDIEYGTLHGSRVLYKATSPYLGAVLVLHDLTNNRARVLCHAGGAIPGRTGETFRSIGSTNWINADSVVFRAASAENPGGPDTHGSAGIYGWFGVKDWGDASPDLVPERLRKVVDGTTSVPLTDAIGGAAFDTFGSAPASGSQTVFWALGQGFSGLFAARTGDGAIRCLVNNHTGIDGQFKGTFTSFGRYPAVLGQNVVFTAEAMDDTEAAADDADDADDAKANAPKTYRGVFVYRLDRGELFTLTDNLAPLGGKEIAGYEIGGHVLVGDRFAVTVTFADKSSQIFLGTIRPEAFKRLTDSAPVEKPDLAR